MDLIERVTIIYRIRRGCWKVLWPGDGFGTCSYFWTRQGALRAARRRREW